MNDEVKSVLSTVFGLALIAAIISLIAIITTSSIALIMSILN